MSKGLAFLWGWMRLPEHRGTVKMELLSFRASQVLVGELDEDAHEQPHGQFMCPGGIGAP